MPTKMRVQSALTFGVTPTRIMEKICTGRVVVLGPDIYVEIITSSRDMARAKSEAVMMEGVTRGKTTVRIICQVVAPRSLADSKMENQG